MKFTRTFHPVGQGAFFTEHFSNEEEKYSTTIVYDCGSTSKKEFLDREIQEHKLLHEDYPFNIMFISHFDEDHINGLPKLIDMFFVDMDYIDGLLDWYGKYLNKSDLVDLIKTIMIELYPNKKDSINQGLIEDLIKENRVKKSLLLNIIEEYYPYPKQLYQKYLIEGHLSSLYSPLNRLVYHLALKRTSISLVRKYRDERDHVAIIIPFLYPNLIKILLPEMSLSDDLRSAFDTLFSSGIKIIGLGDNRNPNNHNLIENRRIRKEDLYKEPLNTIDSFTRIEIRESPNGKVCWYYMPYNTITDGNRGEKFLEELYQSLEEYNGKLGDWFRSEGRYHGKNDNEKAIELFLEDCSQAFLNGDSDITKEFTDLLKQLYKNASKGINGVTAINVNSLNVLSYSSVELKNKLFNAQGEYTYRYNEMELQREFVHQYLKKDETIQNYCDNMLNLNINGYDGHMNDMRYSCLYTGDCVMEDHFFERIGDIHQSLLESKIGLLQIPHHGGRWNYSKRILSAPIFSSFINFGKKGTTANESIQEIENDHCGVEKPCLEITQDIDSKFEQIVTWNNQLLEKKEVIY